MSEINAAEKAFANWFARGRKIGEAYVAESSRNSKKRRYAMLWSNVQTIGPAIYARTPQAVVSRRFKDADPLGRITSEVLERALNYTLESYDFDAPMVLCRQDYLLPGRGQVWVRYVPHMKKVRVDLSPVVAEDGVSISDQAALYEDVTGRQYSADDVEQDEAGAFVQEEQVEYEEVVCDHVSWQDFLHNPAREWAEVRWVGRRVYMTREDLKKRFGEQIGGEVPLDWSPADMPAETRDEHLCKAAIYEIWDKGSRKAVWISKGYRKGPLDERDDPLGLNDFFPCPRPLLATTEPDTLIPTPDYILYQDQAQEVDKLTSRIAVLINALRMAGFYDAKNATNMQQVFASGAENQLIPVEGWSTFVSTGGAKGSIEWVPVDMVVEVLKACVETRQNIITDIYQITGISDIIRGASDPRETAAAQQIKTQWGSIRVRDRQKEIARFARDVIRIKGEIIAEKFSAETLAQMTGVKLFASEQEKQQAQQAMQAQAAMAQQGAPGQPQPTAQAVPPEVQEMVGRPTWVDIKGLLENNASRQFRIEIETDSTAEPDETEQKQAAVEFVTTISEVIGNAGPIVQQVPQLGRLVAESVKFLARRYRAGREMEEIIDRTVDEIVNSPPPSQPETPPPDETPVKVAEIRSQTDMALKSADVQQAQQDNQVKMALAARDPRPQVVA